MHREESHPFLLTQVRVWVEELLPQYLEAASPSLGADTLSLLFSLVKGKLPGAAPKYKCLNRLCFGHA